MPDRMGVSSIMGTHSNVLENQYGQRHFSVRSLYLSVLIKSIG